MKKMIMAPQIEELAEKKLVGNKLMMSLAKDRTRELWSSFMPERNQVQNVISPSLYCMQVYEAT